MATCNFSNDYVYEDSDQEGGSDSDDEIQTWLHGTPKQKRHSQRRSIGLPSDSSEDEFEQEMNRELETTLQSSEYSFGTRVKELKTSRARQLEEDNDQLLYDPALDEEDQKWVDHERRKYQVKVNEEDAKQRLPEVVAPLPKSDAVLNCPACLCTVCLDCQRHSVYKNQYRAMFVMNCLVNYGESLILKSTNKGKKNRKRKAPGGTANCDGSEFNDMEKLEQSDASNHIDQELFHPVTCSNCNTRIAVYDSDEVYHFFNILTSYS